MLNVHHPELPLITLQPFPFWGLSMIHNIASPLFPIPWTHTNFQSKSSSWIIPIMDEIQETLLDLSAKRSSPPLPSPKRLRAGRHKAGLPGNVDMITGSAFLSAPAAGRRGIQPTCPRFLMRNQPVTPSVHNTHYSRGGFISGTWVERFPLSLFSD